MLQHTAPGTPHSPAVTKSGHLVQQPAPQCNTMQHNATQCNTVQHSATQYNTIQHNATQCNTMQHTSPLCNRHTPLGGRDRKRPSFYMGCEGWGPFGARAGTVIGLKRFRGLLCGCAGSFLRRLQTMKAIWNSLSALFLITVIRPW